ncbi:MAG: tetratricopeptide repeat protein [Endozoicomonadaceae bacterium]|nr:tetratricopeptide repeat protein [Endozoicomonadaceae bacterium]
MESVRTEEGELRAIKTFWNSYGFAIVLGLILTLGSVYGYKAWHKHKQEQEQAASSLYNEVLDIVLIGDGHVLTDEQKATLNHLSAALQENAAGSIYTQFTALFKARSAVVEGDLTTAANELKWLLLQKPEREIEIVARLRLAQVLLAQEGKVNQIEALELLNQISQVGAFQGSYGEVRGDVLLALGRRDDAREAYQKAVDVADAIDSQRSLIKMRLDDLAERKEVIQ